MPLEGVYGDASANSQKFLVSRLRESSKRSTIVD